MQSNKALMCLIAGALVVAATAVMFVARSSGAPRMMAEAAELQALLPTPLSAPTPPRPEVGVDVQDNDKRFEPNPRLVVPSLDEPDVALDGKTSERADFVAPLVGGGFIFERRDADGKRIGGVVVPGLVILSRGVVELFGCGEGGKEHETIIRLESNVQALDLALTSAGFRRGKLPAKTDLSLADQGSRVLILVQWLDKDGKPVTYRSEDLVVSFRRNAPMPRVGWTYVGQWMEVADPTSPKGDKKHKVLAATGSRSYITTFRDRSALLDNPLEEAVDDTLFGANYMLLPQPGTPVRIIFRAPTATEREEIAALEKKIAVEAPIQLREGRSREDQDQKK
jgi:hypothetical protein